jgi:hypothetical protein
MDVTTFRHPKQSKGGIKVKRALLVKSLVALVGTLLISGELLRADVTGTILGTVTDPSGAAVPGAKVTLRNPDTGFERRTTTDLVGSYEFLAVSVGENYAVEVEASGFQTSKQTGIKLLVNQKFRADFQLVVGAVTQTVDVSAQAA